MSAIRSVARLPRMLGRLSSSQATASISNDVPSTAKTSLPPHKLRALVSLYHKSENFITPETLDDVIEKAVDNPIYYNLAATERSYGSLREEMLWKQKDPKVGQSIPPKWQTDESRETWSRQSSERQRKVENALFGVEGDQRAGLEVLLEERERIAKHLRNDRKS